MIVNEIVRAVLSYTGANASVAQTVHWYILTQANEDDEDVVDRIEAWATDDWGFRWQDHASDLCTLETLECDIINTDGTVNRNIGERTLSLDGASGAQQLAAGVSALLTALTGTPKIRGRKYIPFFNEGVMNDGQWGPASITHLAAMAADYVIDLGGMTGGILESGVLSRPNEAFYIFQPTGAADTIPAYQRRRKPNVGS